MFQTSGWFQSLVAEEVLFTPTVPTLLGTRDRFHGRQFSCRPWAGGWFRDYSSALQLLCTLFLLLLDQLHLRSSSSRSWRLGTPDLNTRRSGTQQRTPSRRQQSSLLPLCPEGLGRKGASVKRKPKRHHITQYPAKWQEASEKVNEKKEPIRFGKRRRRVSHCQEVRTQEKVVSKGGEQLSWRL